MSSEVGEMLAERSSSASKEDEWERNDRLETWDCLEYRRGSGGGRESSFLGAIIPRPQGMRGVPCDLRPRLLLGVWCQHVWALCWPGLA